MKFINFYPGPSKLEPSVGEQLLAGFNDGVFESNHRSEIFETLLQKTKNNLTEKLGIPSGYEVVLTSSATECWEVIAQSVIAQRSLHLYNGAFGKKWFAYTEKLIPGTLALDFGVNGQPEAEALVMHKDVDVICITHNETSNGTRVSLPNIRSIKERFPDCLVAVDATSSLSGEHLDISSADIWYASVQKCFGLPPGLAVLILSPQALEQVKRKNENKHYNSLVFALDNFRKNQTPYTPNIPGIYLLNAILEQRQSITSIDLQTKKRFQLLKKHLESIKGLSFISANESNLSYTVLALKGNEALIASLKTKAKQNNILLGNGYGPWKSNSFRVANFPALTDDEINQLIDKVK